MPDLLKNVFTTPLTPEEKSFKNLLQKKMTNLLTVVNYAVINKDNTMYLARHLLDQFYIESSSVEEFMDIAGAKTNLVFSKIRSENASIKNFSKIYYKLLHIEASLENYKLLEVKGNFKEDLEKAILKTHTILLLKCTALLETCLFYDLDIPLAHHLDYSKNNIELASNLLQSNLPLKQEEKPAIVIISIATDFLNLADDNSISDFSKLSLCQDSMLDLIPESFSSEKLRMLETRFHNMQSKYDTFLSPTNIPKTNEKIIIMRGLISVIYHLSIIATFIIHYYQRHYVSTKPNNSIFTKNVNTPDEMLSIIDFVSFFSISYIDKYRKTSRDLCRELISQYATKTTISLKTPSYRGFHVRPSTLISRIILHYGSDVVMMIYGTEYNAAVPFNLFRANEELNLNKRKLLFSSISKTKAIKFIQNDTGFSLDTLKNITRTVFWELSENQKILIYEPSLNFNDIEEKKEEESCLDFIKRVIERYMALGKIDAETDTMVAFHGDERVLADIKTLAEYGYGEDRFGNNIILPRSLDYLRF